MNNRVIPPEVQVLGQSIMAMVGGMELLKSRAMKILAENGIPALEPQGWYPMRNALTAIGSIEQKIGPVTMRAVGRKVPEHAKFPPEITTISGFRMLMMFAIPVPRKRAVSRITSVA